MDGRELPQTSAFGRKQLYAALKYWLDERPLPGGKQLLNLADRLLGVNLIFTLLPGY